MPGPVSLSLGVWGESAIEREGEKFGEFLVSRSQTLRWRRVPSFSLENSQVLISYRCKCMSVKMPVVNGFKNRLAYKTVIVSTRPWPDVPETFAAAPSYPSSRMHIERTSEYKEAYRGVVLYPM